MEKQLLIYSQVVPVNKDKHKNISVKSGTDFSFARDINSAPLTAIEIPFTASEFTIVFTGSGDNIMPAVILGLRDGENAYLNNDGQMTSSYVPAFLRRYPFIFSTNDEGKTFTLCIDESFSGCNEYNKGERLFDGDGEQTSYVKNVLSFLQEYQAHFTRTQAFCKKLSTLELLTPMEAVISPKDGDKSKVTGFLTVSREKLSKLSDEDLLSLAKSGELELIHLHLHSLRHFNTIANKMTAQQADTTSEEKTAEVH